MISVRVCVRITVYVKIPIPEYIYAKNARTTTYGKKTYELSVLGV